MIADSQRHQLRDKDSFPYIKEISKSYGKLDDIISWCKTELCDEWRWSLTQPSSDVTPGRYVFYFDSERDACAFMLKWS